ncbi:MAG: glycosyl hydrolase, partial [Bacteroidota bacterium]
SNYLGNINMYDQETETLHDIMAYPASNLGKKAIEHQYRFNWNAPVLHNPQEANLIYHGANHLLASKDNGISWQEISPDLTRNERTKQDLGGFPFTNEGAGAEVYNTISYLACSKFNKDEIWVGTDDGLIHITHDGGQSWDNITPPSLPEAFINSIEVSIHQPGTAFIVAYRYKFNDLKPYLYQTTDYGKHWKTITKGLPQNFGRVLRQDPVNPDILYLGMENGMFVSFNQGNNWHPFQLDLPVCSITDILIKNKDLVVATAGRGIWILDDISPIQQSGGSIEDETLRLFQPMACVRHQREEPAFSDTYLGENPSCGLALDYHLPESKVEMPLILSIYNEAGELVRHFKSEKDSLQIEYHNSKPLLPKLRGVNRFHWNLRGASLPGINGQQTTGDYRGSIVPPGEYTIKLSNGVSFSEQKVIIKPDSRIPLEWTDYKKQADLLAQVEGELRDIHSAVNKVQVVQNQINILVDFLEKSEEHKELVEKGTTVIIKIEQWKEKIIQTNWQSNQDFINYPGKLNADFLDLKQRLDKTFPMITEGMQTRVIDLKTEWKSHKAIIKDILESDVTEFNRIFKEKNIPALILPSVNAF